MNQPFAVLTSGRDIIRAVREHPAKPGKKKCAVLRTDRSVAFAASWRDIERLAEREGVIGRITAVVLRTTLSHVQMILGAPSFGEATVVDWKAFSNRGHGGPFIGGLCSPG